MTTIYNSQFRGNVLVVGKKGCGKTTFLEKLGINNFFGNLVKTEWISGIDNDEKREAKIHSCFSNETGIHIAEEPDELDLLLETFKFRTHDIPDDNVNSSFGKNKKMDCLIVMDDVSVIADISKKFGNFLTVSRKFGYHPIYVFYVIMPATQIWQKIIFQTNFFNIFPSSIRQNTVAKILQRNCVGQSKKYVPIRSLRLNRVFTDLANTNEKHCLTIDCSNRNKNGPGKYRTAADNPDQQVCYFNKPHNDQFYNVFVSKRIKAEHFNEGICFKIEKAGGKTEKDNFDAKKTLEDGTSNDRFSKLFSISKSEQRGAGKDMQILLNTFSEEIESQQGQDFFQDDNNVLKNKKNVKSNYSSTKVKARNLLTNILNRRYEQKEFNNVSFIVYIFIFNSKFYCD